MRNRKRWRVRWYIVGERLFAHGFRIDNGQRSPRTACGITPGPGEHLRESEAIRCPDCTAAIENRP